nr:hypothetical protein [uncultured Chryseobacterium sp.]
MEAKEYQSISENNRSVSRFLHRKTLNNCIVLIIMLVLLMSCKKTEIKKSNFPNYLQNSHWIVDRGGLIAPNGDKIYDLSKRRDSAMMLNFYAIDFLDEEKFKSYDSWECGNDCFTEIHGKYYFTKAHQIEMEVDSISRWGTCDAPTQIFNPAKEMVFDIVEESEQLKLIRK